MHKATATATPEVDFTETSLLVPLLIHIYSLTNTYKCIYIVWVRVDGCILISSIDATLRNKKLFDAGRSPVGLIRQAFDEVYLWPVAGFIHLTSRPLCCFPWLLRFSWETKTVFFHFFSLFYLLLLIPPLFTSLSLHSLSLNFKYLV